MARPVLGRDAPETDGRAYWGVVYLPFFLKNNAEYEKLVGDGKGATAGLAWARSLFQCPGNTVTDLDPGYSENYVSDQGATLGLNALIAGKRLSRYKNASELILCHDAWEHLLEGNAGGDWLMAYSVIAVHPTNGVAVQKQNGNLLQYMGEPYAKTMRYSYYRHKKQSGVLWFDGHVSFIHESNGTDIPPHWYAGDNVLVR